MKKDPRFSLATALLVTIGTAPAIAQTNRHAAGSTGACCLPITNLATIVKWLCGALVMLAGGCLLWNA